MIGLLFTVYRLRFLFPADIADIAENFYVNKNIENPCQ